MKMTYEKVDLRSNIGWPLAGAIHKAEGDKAVVMCHGSCSSKDRDRYVTLADRLQKEGITAARFDFAGCGESHNSNITVENHREDLYGVREYLFNRGYKSLGTFGESLGGLVALDEYNQEGTNALVLWAPVTKAKTPTLFQDPEKRKELKREGFYVYHKNGKDYFIGRKYLDEREFLDREALLSKIGCPTLIIHGGQDQTVPIEHSQEALKYLPGCARLWTLRGEDHVFKDKLDKAIELTVKWFKQYL